MKKEYYIYQVTNLINGKKYIGQHYGKLNDLYLGSGVKLVKAIKKYGKANFKKEILEICSKENIDQKEKDYIKKFNAVEDPQYYNLADGGQLGDGWTTANRYFQQNPEIAKIIYQTNGERLQQWIKDHPEQAKTNTEKMLKSAHEYWANNPEKMIEHMQEVNLAKEQWQKNHPEEHQQQIDKWRKAGSKANSQQIKCVTTGEIFDSQCAASRHYNIPQANISKCLKGERKSAGKHPITKEKMKWELLIN